MGHPTTFSWYKLKNDNKKTDVVASMCALRTKYALFFFRFIWIQMVFNAALNDHPNSNDGIHMYVILCGDFSKHKVQIHNLHNSDKPHTHKRTQEK